MAALLLAYMMPSLRTMFTTGSAVALALFTAIAGCSLQLWWQAAHPKLHAGLPFLCGACCVALTALFLLTEQLADRGVQRGAQRTVPVYTL
ncbi:MAG: hypothetical protein ACLVJH_08970 [Faecalibacterium prausnitzii]